MRPLICLIFSHLESMPRHHPCLLLSERHQSNSHWCAIIIAQMAMRVERERLSTDMRREKTERGRAGWEKKKQKKKKTGRRREIEWCFPFKQQPDGFLNVGRSRSHVFILQWQYTFIQLRSQGHTHKHALQHIQWARLWHAFIPEAFSCQGKSLLSETVSHTMQWPLPMFLDSWCACYSDVRGLLGVAESHMCFYVPWCMCQFTFHSRQGKTTPLCKQWFS